MEAGLAAGMWVAAGVLGWAGVAKIARPNGTRTALRLARLPSSLAATRLLGVAELVIGLGALVVGGPVAGAPLAAAYAALAAFSHRQRRRPQATCGCFGDADAPLTARHVAINAAAALVAGGAAVAGAPGLVEATWSQPAVLMAAVVSTATAAGLLTQCLTTVPTLAARLATSRGADARRGEALGGEV